MAAYKLTGSGRRHLEVENGRGAAGLVLGLAGAAWLSRFLQTLLSGITAADPITYAAVAVLVTFTALLSWYLPALRAMRIDPARALRTE